MMGSENIMGDIINNTNRSLKEACDDAETQAHAGQCRDQGRAWLQASLAMGTLFNQLFHGLHLPGIMAGTTLTWQELGTRYIHFETDGFLDQI